MFIDWEKRHAFLDNLDAIAWQRGEFDCSRTVPMWEHQFASRLDPVREKASSCPVR